MYPSEWPIDQLSLSFRRKSLTRTGVKRLREAKSRFKTYSAKLSPERRKKYEDMYTELGLFDLGRQVVQVCFALQLIPFASFSDLGMVFTHDFCSLGASTLW